MCVCVTGSLCCTVEKFPELCKPTKMEKKKRGTLHNDNRISAPRRYNDLKCAYLKIHEAKT